jgi:hypothetical protein
MALRGFASCLASSLEVFSVDTGFHSDRPIIDDAVPRAITIVLDWTADLRKR